jgi:hypothetical protein
MSRALCAFLLLFAMSWPTSADNAKPLTTILLVARAELPDPNFKDSVVLVMNNIGPTPVGVIINRPTRIAVSRLFPDLERVAQLDDKVYFGGPVEIATVSFLVRADKAPRACDGSSRRRLRQYEPGPAAQAARPRQADGGSADLHWLLGLGAGST